MVSPIASITLMRLTAQLNVAKDEFRCNEGWCIPKARKCDGIKDCFGGEDEGDCGEYESLVISNLTII